MNFRWILLVLSLLACTGVASAQSKVVITGGVDETQHNYTWQLTNRSNARIVRVEIPQYGANMFTTPAEWKQGTQKEMNLVNVGWDYKNPGRCWAEPEPPYPGLAPGATAVFRMQIAGMGALRGRGTVHVKFDDGTVADVPGVELPTMPTSTSPWAALLGTGLIFAAFIVIRERRRRRVALSTPVEQEVEVSDG